MLREPSLGKEGERPEEQQPLLVEEGPASPDTPQHGAALSRAIAIIRYIEAITGGLPLASPRLLKACGG